MFENLTNEGMLDSMEFDFTICKLKYTGYSDWYIWQKWIREA